MYINLYSNHGRSHFPCLKSLNERLMNATGLDNPITRTRGKDVHL